MVKLYPRCLPASNFGRFAKMISFFVKHSSTIDGEEPRITGREPNLMYKIGLYWFETLASVLWRGFFKR